MSNRFLEGRQDRQGRVDRDGNPVAAGPVPDQARVELVSGEHCQDDGSAKKAGADTWRDIGKQAQTDETGQQSNQKDIDHGPCPHPLGDPVELGPVPGSPVRVALHRPQQESQ